jgi:hypothetical protein
MESICAIFLASLFVFGGAMSQPIEKHQREQQTTKDEIVSAVDTIFRRLETLNADALFELYSNSPTFMLFTTEGSMADYQAAKRHHIAWFKQLSALRVSTAGKQAAVLSDDVAVCAWHGTFDMTFNSGSRTQVEFGITFLFTKRDKHWKVGYQQTAQLPPTQQGTSK